MVGGVGGMVAGPLPLEGPAAGWSGLVWLAFSGLAARFDDGASVGQLVRMLCSCGSGGRCGDESSSSTPAGELPI